MAGEHIYSEKEKKKKKIYYLSENDVAIYIYGEKRKLENIKEDCSEGGRQLWKGKSGKRERECEVHERG